MAFWYTSASPSVEIFNLSHRVYHSRVLSKLVLDGCPRDRSCTFEGNGFFVELVQTTKRETRFDRPLRSTSSLIDSLTLLAPLARLLSSSLFRPFLLTSPPALPRSIALLHFGISRLPSGRPGHRLLTGMFRGTA